MRLTGQTFKTWDGAELFYRTWIPEGEFQKAILLFHRGHEHSGRWQETVETLKLDDVAIFAWDQRGHGRSPGERGSAENLAMVIKDADEFAKHVCKTFGLRIENIVVIAHSVGAVIATAWVHDYAPRICALVLATPAFRVKLYVPLAVPFLRLKQKILGPGYVKSYVKAKMLTHDPAAAKAYQEDPLIFRQIAVNILLDLQDTSTRLLADAAAINVPTLILAAGNDWVVKLSAQQQFFRDMGSPVKQMDYLPGFGHAIFHETGRAIVIEKIRKFVLDSFARAWPSNGWLEADKGGFARTEYDLLRAPGGPQWRLVRMNLKIGGMLSAGIRLGWETGFDSGATLDYVYENKPRGVTPLGRCVDWFYLNSIGWRGIRVRRKNLECSLRRCIEQTHQAGRDVRILDIASGPGRYVLETMKGMGDIPTSALLRDYRQNNIDAARKLAGELGLKDVVVTLGDAFDRDSLAAISTRPTIAIVSGLFELIPDNERVLRAIGGIADAMEEGGYLIYTNQPWHPQMEFIARALTNREGQPWIMRRRAQAEMDELVEISGFEKISQDLDPWGIFTVSVARRKAK